MNRIQGTPANWKKFLYEVLSIIKQLGLPTFSMILSCADLRRNELISTFSVQGSTVFFKVVIVDVPPAKIKYHTIRVEFQVQGSPHIHSFLWFFDNQY